MDEILDLPIEKCWKNIGVYGDMSCTKLSEFIHCRNCPEFTRSGRELFNQNIITKEQLGEWTRKNAIPKQDEKIENLAKK